MLKQKSNNNQAGNTSEDFIGEFWNLFVLEETPSVATGPPAWLVPVGQQRPDAMCLLSSGLSACPSIQKEDSSWASLGNCHGHRKWVL